MHDEATTHFMGQIDQTTLGHSFLKKELGVVPTVGWQVCSYNDMQYYISLHQCRSLHIFPPSSCRGLFLA